MFLPNVNGLSLGETPSAFCKNAFSGPIHRIAQSARPCVVSNCVYVPAHIRLSKKPEKRDSRLGGMVIPAVWGDHAGDLRVSMVTAHNADDHATRHPQSAVFRAGPIGRRGIAHLPPVWACRLALLRRFAGQAKSPRTNSAKRQALMAGRRYLARRPLGTAWIYSSYITARGQGKMVLL